MSNSIPLKVYLSGEIHTDWRQEIISESKKMDLPVVFFSPQLDHAKSDDCGDILLGKEAEPFWKDHKSAKINGIRTRYLLDQADVVVVRFGNQYKQWNAAFHAGYAAALGKTLITLHDETLVHPLKEVDAAAMAVAAKPSQIVEILNYILNE